jgi:surfeit locus 1 family protein
MTSFARRLTLLALVLVAAVFVRLGFWQLERAANRAAVEARAEPPRELGLGADWTAEELDQRRVEASGEFDHSHEIVIRGQAFQGTPGVLVVTPLRLAGSDSAVLVLRGFVPSADAVRADISSLREPGEVRVRGLATAIANGSGHPLEHDGRTTWARLDLAALRARLPYPVLPVLLRQTPDSGLPQQPRRLPAASRARAQRGSPSELCNPVVRVRGDGGGVRSAGGKARRQGPVVTLNEVKGPIFGMAPSLRSG